MFKFNRIPLSREDWRLASLATAISRQEVKLEIGIPVPEAVENPGTYFGAMAMLKYLVSKGVLDSEKVAELIVSDRLSPRRWNE
jgi:hypothetical protein